MRTYLAILLVIVAAAGLLSASGCVSKVEYDKARALCRRANEELRKSQETLQAAQDEKAAMSARLANSDRTLAAKQKEIALLEEKGSNLQESLDKLKALYDKARQTDVPPPIGSIVVLPAPVDKALRGFAKMNPELVEYLPQYGMVKFKSDFTFDKGSDDVSDEAIKALGKLVEILNGEAASIFHVYVAGHTDDIPIRKPATLRRHPTNWYLSVHRAVEVQKELVKANLAPGRIGAMGFGEYHPIEPNKPGKKGNVKNRRVEIWIVPPDRFLVQPTEKTAEQ